MKSGRAAHGQSLGYYFSTTGEERLSREETKAESHWVRDTPAATRRPDGESKK